MKRTILAIALTLAAASPAWADRCEKVVAVLGYSLLPAQRAGFVDQCRAMFDIAKLGENPIGRVTVEDALRVWPQPMSRRQKLTADGVTEILYYEGAILTFTNGKLSEVEA